MKKTETHRMLEDAAQILAEISEELAIEILAEFQNEDLPHLAKTLSRLSRAEEFLMGLNTPIPGSVAQLMRQYRSASRH